MKDTLKCAVCQGKVCAWDVGKAGTEKESNICKICGTKENSFFFFFPGTMGSVKITRQCIEGLYSLQGGPVRL